MPAALHQYENVRTGQVAELQAFPQTEARPALSSPYEDMRAGMRAQEPSHSTRKAQKMAQQAQASVDARHQ